MGHVLLAKRVGDVDKHALICFAGDTATNRRRQVDTAANHEQLGGRGQGVSIKFHNIIISNSEQQVNMFVGADSCDGVVTEAPHRVLDKTNRSTFDPVPAASEAAPVHLHHQPHRIPN
ncbi:hypothetical protein DPEC_G00297760 [Dallia pectoralis]|uniref:Uncharacterized protein n=1 Tax=Dallia pectoralis TaxID=75939 RepID=A0ACC2FFU2_DALPE|nr:hypothetical protein DPEC_G00297760 [Dallia pectoralis]